MLFEPPGGGKQPTHCTSIIFFQANDLGERSNRPLRSMNSLSNAIGCWVPYTSTIGMEMLSIKNNNDFLPGGPRVSLERLSRLDSSEFCTSKEDVLDEKFRLKVLYKSVLKLFM